MKLGIVGSESKFWSKLQEKRAKEVITMLLCDGDILVSGGCHKGGIDIWAEEIADGKGLEKFIFPPEKLSWYWYKKRNIKIAKTCDMLIDIEPGDMESGGFWTLNYARSIGKLGMLIKL